MINKFFFGFLFLSSCIHAFSQQTSNVKFGKITPADFIINSPLINSDTKAVIVSDVGNTSFTGNNDGGFNYVYKRQVRVKILSKAGINIASIKIRLLKKDNDKQILSDVDGTTYNLENDHVVETKLDKADIYEEELDKNHFEKKFALPAIKEGSIFEVSYTITSDFNFTLPSWQFQNVTYPCLWSEYKVEIPNLLIYTIMRQGLDSFYIAKSDRSYQRYLATSHSTNGYSPTAVANDIGVSTTVNIHRWVMKDVRPLAIENYMSSPENYVDKIDFQISKVSNGETFTDIMNSWPKAAEELLKDNDFGGTLSDDNYWLDKDLNSIIEDRQNQLEIANRIYNFVRRYFTCTNRDWYLIQTSLKEVYNKRSGNVGEINLLLIAMLRKKGISADPVILSTRENGFCYIEYPMLENFNYLICRAVIDDKIYYLDASSPHMGFAHLPNDCYNGFARIINNIRPDSIYLTTDSLKETKITSAFVFNNENGGLSAQIQSTPGYFESLELRDQVLSGKQEEYFNEIKNDYGLDLQNTSIDSLQNFEMPVTLHYNVNLKTGDDVVYFNPMLTQQLKKNPFGDTTRLYPVMLKYCADETYVLNIEVPKGYVVDALPKSTRVKLNENDGVFEYIIQQSGNRIQLRSTVQLKKANFSRDDYQNLRNFFAYIVKKQAEVIVLKKGN